ncbi:MAG: DNA polymerase A family protein [Candidatus Freyarchaeota archaeon]
MYIPEDGNIFVSADYNQIELRIAALLAHEITLLEAFDRGDDIHKRVASEVYKVRMSEVTPLQRFRAKFIVYGLGYGRGARSIARQYKELSYAEADRFITTYFNTFPNIKRWRQTLVTEAQRKGYLVNPFGRRRYFFGPGNIPKVYNFLPQSTAADVLLEALVRLDGELPKGARMVLTVHDSILVECPEDMKDEVAECLKDVMEKPVDALDNYVIPVKVTFGKTWEETE